MEKLLTAQEVADLIGGRSAKWVYKLAAEGRIPCVRLTDGTIRFRPEDLKQWFESSKSETF